MCLIVLVMYYYYTGKCSLHHCILLNLIRVFLAAGSTVEKRVLLQSDIILLCILVVATVDLMREKAGRPQQLSAAYGQT